MANLVQEWKNYKKRDPEAVRVWNNYALDYGISGYNLFIKFGRKASIQVPATASGTGSATVTITYDFGTLGSDGMIIIQWPDGTYETFIPETTSGSYDYTATRSGTYKFWVGSIKVYDDYEGAAHNGVIARITKWSPDTANGVAKAAECNVTV